MTTEHMYKWVCARKDTLCVCTRVCEYISVGVCMCMYVCISIHTRMEKEGCRWHPPLDWLIDWNAYTIEHCSHIRWSFALTHFHYHWLGFFFMHQLTARTRHLSPFVVVLIFINAGEWEQMLQGWVCCKSFRSSIMQVWSHGRSQHEASSRDLSQNVCNKCAWAYLRRKYDVREYYTHTHTYIHNFPIEHRTENRE